MDDLAHKIEAILFSVGNRISVEEISKLVRQKDHELIKKTLMDLRTDIQKRNGPMMLLQEGNLWKLNVKEEHIQTVRKVVKKMELPKTLLETLASVAWKAPVMQSKIIAIRTNKAYDHLDQLEELGYISRKKYGRTKMINLAQKFYDYFEINKKGGLGKIFKRVTDRAKQKFPESSVVSDEQTTLEEVETPKKKTAADKELEKIHAKGLIQSRKENEVVNAEADIEVDTEAETEEDTKVDAETGLEADAETDIKADRESDVKDGSVNESEVETNYESNSDFEEMVEEKLEAEKIVQEETDIENNQESKEESSEMLEENKDVPS